MTFEFRNADASYIYRESSSSSSYRLDGTANTGSLFELMRDTVVAFGITDPRHNNESGIPSSAGGDVKAVFRQR